VVTPWMVVLTPPGPFGDVGAPVANEQGELVALVADGGANPHGYARFTDAGAIRAVLRAWRDGGGGPCPTK
jgi:hypothetical protein